MTRKSLALAQLVEDLSVYPRHAVDESHVAQLANALRSGATFPPLIVSADGFRIVDGWHRARATRRVVGPTAVVDVDVRSYANEQELLLDAIRLNASHGRKFDRIDQARAIVMASNAGVSVQDVAAVLHMPEDRAEALRVRIALAPTDSEANVPGTRTIVLKRPMAHLAGTSLTAEQAAAHDSMPGVSFLLIANQLSEALRLELVNREDERLEKGLRALSVALEAWLP